MFLPITPRVPSKTPSVDWIVGIPASCFAAVRQFPLTLHVHTVTGSEKAECECSVLFYTKEQNYTYRWVRE